MRNGHSPVWGKMLVLGVLTVGWQIRYTSGTSPVVLCVDLWRERLERVPDPPPPPACLHGAMAHRNHSCRQHYPSRPFPGDTYVAARARKTWVCSTPLTRPPCPRANIVGRYAVNDKTFCFLCGTIVSFLSTRPRPLFKYMPPYSSCPPPPPTDDAFAGPRATRRADTLPSASRTGSLS